MDKINVDPDINTDITADHYSEEKGSLILTWKFVDLTFKGNHLVATNSIVSTFSAQSYDQTNSPFLQCVK